jgi:hypothetical protein
MNVHTPLQIENERILRGWLKQFCQSESMAVLGVAIGSKEQYVIMASPEFTPERLIFELENIKQSVIAHQQNNKS